MKYSPQVDRLGFYFSISETLDIYDRLIANRCICEGVTFGKGYFKCQFGNYNGIKTIDFGTKSHEIKLWIVMEVGGA